MHRFYLLLVVCALCLCSSASRFGTSYESNNWVLVYRAQAGNNQSVMNVYLNGSSECGSDEAQVCRNNYRNNVLDRWDTLGVYKVKLEVFRFCKSVGTVVFEGRRSTATNVFKQRRIFSTWEHITVEDGNYYFGFKKDKADYPRERARILGYKPVFLYKSQQGAEYSDADVKEADVLAVYLDARELKHCF